MASCCVADTTTEGYVGISFIKESETGGLLGS